MSGMPSPLRSATATETAAVPVAKVSLVWKEPSRLPRSTLTLLSDRLAVTMSGMPSPLRSATATWNGAQVGGGGGCCAPKEKVPSPLPSSTLAVSSP